ncbi:high-potential iron-sulfur protein [Fluviibacter phosphoraccumulans]|jgi:anaerobic selenocysteine-containing dehydrogenase|uniref:High-potential iron-sulfur protein n=1 Tax=Fluviibacter phosphoraccumulans TaxID=1751046 RepID=A0A679I3N0_9RHOO|nr:high-potential iron-sulfur protein [Fluviibacter phosphoraccumulans]BBU69095.1 high-potential iron-sulfur protein [Fluviibacter phosphoraccumulans]BCA65030.1 high-potential iron-sulfur protein [Fluviibacter phosphoraccumulans]
MSLTRRNFLKTSLLASAAITFIGKASAGTPVSESDAQAKSLGYVANASKADKAKFPKFAAGQACSNCSLYQGKTGSTSGPCPIFAGKDVAAAGWCSAYVKKA